LESCYDTFLVVILNINKNNARERVHNSFKLPWYTKDLKKLKNLRNKFYKRFLVTQDPGDWNRHLQHKRELEFLNKFLYNQYIASVENGLKSNPNSFWRFINSKKNASSVPSAMFLGNLPSHSNTETANLFCLLF